MCLEKHPDKTFIGKADRGFDFLGYHFGSDGLSVAEGTVAKFVERVLRLYEQERSERGNSDLLGPYLRRWTAWLQGGLEERAPMSSGGWPDAPRQPSQAHQADQE